MKLNLLKKIKLKFKDVSKEIKLKKDRIKSKIIFKNEFHYIINDLLMYINCEEYEKEDLTNYLDFIISLYLNHIKYINLKNYIVKKPKLNKKYLYEIYSIPVIFDFVEKEKQYVLYNNPKIIFISFPFRNNRILDFFKCYRKGKFKILEENINGYFVPYINAVFTHNGNHSSLFAEYNNIGEGAFYEVINLEKMFEFIDLNYDLEFTYNNKPTFYNSCDYKICMIYKLAKIKWIINNTIDKKDLILKIDDYINKNSLIYL